MNSVLQTVSEGTVNWARAHMPLSQAAIAQANKSGALKGLAITLDLAADAKALAFAAALQDAGCDVGFAKQDRAASIVVGHGGVSGPNGAVDLQASPLRAFLEDSVGIGQASVMAVVDITNLQLAGRPIGVFGYDDASKSIADYAKALGGRVTVLEQNPTAALRANYQGHFTSDDAAALADMDVVFVTSKHAARMVSEQANALREGVLICNVTTEVRRGDFPASEGETNLRQGVTQVATSSGKSLKLLADGAPVHLAAARGYPIEIADAKYAMTVAAIVQLLEAGEGSGTQTLSQDAEDQIAQAVLNRHRQAGLRRQSA